MSLPLTTTNMALTGPFSSSTSTTTSTSESTPTHPERADVGTHTTNNVGVVIGIAATCILVLGCVMRLCRPRRHLQTWIRRESRGYEDVELACNTLSRNVSTSRDTTEPLVGTRTIARGRLQGISFVPSIYTSVGFASASASTSAPPAYCEPETHFMSSMNRHFGAPVDSVYVKAQATVPDLTLAG